MSGPLRPERPNPPVRREAPPRRPTPYAAWADDDDDDGWFVGDPPAREGERRPRTRGGWPEI